MKASDKQCFRSTLMASSLRSGCFLAVLFLVLIARGQWVQVDSTFPQGSGPQSHVVTMAVEDEGSVLIGGAFTSISGLGQTNLARVYTNGSVDATFKPGVMNSFPKLVQLQTDGKILVSGTFTSVNGIVCPGFVRLLRDGTRDPGFTLPPVLPASGQLSPVAAPDFSVWVTGTFTNLGGLPRNRIARLLSNGAVDPNFYSPFTGTEAISVLGVHTDGKAFVTGSFSNIAGQAVIRLARLNSNGSVDLSFVSGLDPSEKVLRAALQPDGKLVVATAVATEPLASSRPQRVVRLTGTGALDPEFKSLLIEFPGLYSSGVSVTSIALQPDGGILIGGTFVRVGGMPRGGIARLMPDGSVDPCFQAALSGEMVPLALGAEAGGTVLVGGSFAGLLGQTHNNFLRLIPVPCEPGVISMGVPALQALRGGWKAGVPVVRQGGADLEQTVVFSTRNGSAQAGIDYTESSGVVHFARGERSQSISIPLLGAAPQTSSKSFEVLISEPLGGASLGLQTNTVVTITGELWSTAGAADTNYVVQVDGPISAILPLPGGGTIIVGGFTNVNGEFCPNFARLQPNGARDNTFNRPQRFSGELEDVALDSAGRVIIAGYFSQVDGVFQPGLARFGVDGALDSSFAPLALWPTNSSGAAEAHSVTVLADETIICSASLPLSGGSHRDILLKFSAQGELDQAFTNAMPPNVFAYQLKERPGGGVFVIGTGFGASLCALTPGGALDLSFIPPADRQFRYSSGKIGVLPDGRTTAIAPLNYFYGVPGDPSLWRFNPDGSSDSGFALDALQSTLTSIDAHHVSADGRVLLAGSYTNSSSTSLVRLNADGTFDPSFDQGTGLKGVSSAYATINAIAELPQGGWLIGGEFASYDGFNQRHIVRILPDNSVRAPTFAFSVANLSLVETNTVLAVELRRTGDASSTAGVTVLSVNGMAVAGQDYLSVHTNLVFAPGEWTKTIGVEIRDDSLLENTEQFTLVLTNATAGFALGTPSSLTVSILNDEPTSTVGFSAAQFQAIEEDGFAMIRLKWTGTGSTNQSVRIQITPVSGSSQDLGVSTLLVYRPATVTSTNWVRIPIRDTVQNEPRREFRLRLQAGTGLGLATISTASLFLEDRDFATTPARGVAGVVTAVVASPGGGVYLAGDFTGVHGETRNRVARLLPDGEVDPSFDPGAGPNDFVLAAGVQPDGKLLIAGGFTAVSGVPRAGLARLHPNGALDVSFEPGTGIRTTNGSLAYVTVLQALEDGKVLVGGSFSHYQARRSPYLVRLHANGNADTSFSSPFPDVSLGRLPVTVYGLGLRSLSVQADGKMLLTGSFPQGSAYWSLTLSVVRLYPSGATDSSFATTTTEAYGLAAGANGEFFVGGTSTQSWLPVRRIGTNGVADRLFVVRNLPAVTFGSSFVRQIMVQPGGELLCCAVLSPLSLPRTSTPFAAVIVRLLANGNWDNTFAPVSCSLPLLESPGAYWFNSSRLSKALSVEPPAPTAFLAQQPDGVLVIGGAFDYVNGEERRRLARLEPSGELRGRPSLRLLGTTPPRLILPAEVEAPYRVETSLDLSHWYPWLVNEYPWWPAELWIQDAQPQRFFRMQSVNE